MSIIKKLLALVIALLDTVLPALNIPQEFIDNFDGFITWMISTFESASWFLPLNVLVGCLTAIFIVDSTILGLRIGQWVLRTVRG